MNTRDPDLRALLRALRGGDFSCLGALADRLDELEHPKSDKVRFFIRRHQSLVLYWAGEGFSQRKHRRVGRVERVARCHRWLYAKLNTHVGFPGREWGENRLREWASEGAHRVLDATKSLRAVPPEGTRDTN
jgi:hypothetical protein